MISNATEVHLALRHGTAALHEAVEARMDLPSRLSSLASYCELIERFSGIVVRLEARLAAFPWPDDLAMESRRKAPLLAADLAALNVRGPEDSLGASASSLPSLPCHDAAYGCLYVLEGSTLGGRVILKQIESRLGLGPEHGARFFAGYGNLTGRLWTDFLHVLGREIRTPDAIGRALGGAEATFKALDGWLNGPVAA